MLYYAIIRLGGIREKCFCRLDLRWSQFRDLVDQKKDSLNSALGVQNYHLECNETKSWIREKTKVIESTQELGNDLTGVMALQRKLTGMERDLAAIEDKLGDLKGEAARLGEEHPDQASAITGQLEEIAAVWEEMCRCSWPLACLGIWVRT